MSMYIRAGRYCTIGQYAESMGLKPDTIRVAIRKGRLAGTFKLGHEVFVPEDAILEYRNVKHGLYIGFKAARRKPNKTPADGKKLAEYREAKKKFYGKYDQE